MEHQLEEMDINELDPRRIVSMLHKWALSIYLDSGVKIMVLNVFSVQKSRFSACLGYIIVGSRTFIWPKILTLGKCVTDIWSGDGLMVKIMVLNDFSIEK